MKKRALLFTIFGAFAYLILSSNSTGPAATFPYTNCTGSQASQTNCAGSTCHGTGGGTAVAVYLYSAVNFSTTIDTILPNKPYAVIIQGANSNLNTHKYGFQLSAVYGTGAAQVQAGVWSQLPTNTVSTPFPAATPTINIVENSSTLVSGAIATGNFADTVFWNSPSSGSSPITFYCTLLAVNGNGQADTNDVSGNHSLQVSFRTTSVPSISQSTVIQAYPNPFSSQFRLQMNNAEAGNYTLKVYDLSGKALFKESVQMNGSSFETSINTSNWPSGFYGVQVLDKNGAQRIIPVIKQ